MLILQKLKVLLQHLEEQSSLLTVHLVIFTDNDSLTNPREENHCQYAVNNCMNKIVRLWLLGFFVVVVKFTLTIQTR